MNSQSIAGAMVLVLILRLAVPFFLAVAAALFLTRVRRWFSAVMATGAGLNLLFALPSVALHPLLPLFRLISTQQFSQISTWLSVLSSLSWLCFAVGFAGLAVGRECGTPHERGKETMKNLSRMALIGFLAVCQSCATAKLWEDTNPNERIWIDSSKITEEALKKRGVAYQVETTQWGTGYLVEKSAAEKMKDYHLRMLGAPVTLVVDAATTVVVVGVYMFLNDPDGTCDLIRAASHHH
jgi:hypothetical protein